MRESLVPEEAVVDAAAIDPLGAARILSILAECESPVRLGRLTDIARGEGFARDRMENILAALSIAGLVNRQDEGLFLSTNKQEAVRHAAVLRGVAYAQYRQRDRNQVEITLSPPAHPSRLMEVLPRQGFAWARLYDTKDSLIELASQASRRFTVVSPFLDLEGMEWISDLFRAASGNLIARTLILRGHSTKDLELLAANRHRFAEWDARVMSYAIPHSPDLRSPVIETFHAKILISDSDRAYIGSANMNRSSRDYSMECGVIIRGPCVKPVAALLEAIQSIATAI